MSRTPCHSRATWLSGFIACMLLMLAPASHAQEGYGKSDDPVAAVAHGVEIRTSNAGEMAYVIKQVLSVTYAREHDLQATDAEVSEFIARKKELDARARKDMQARQDKIEKSLQAKDLPDTEREQLQGELKFLQQMQQAAVDADKQADKQERVAAETQMARAIIGQWRVNKALYKQYGGRVIYQQGGAEPLDAYYKFFKAAQQTGDLKFVNKELEPAFWSYFSSDSKHKFYPEKEKDQAINTPWWLKDPRSGK